MRSSKRERPKQTVRNSPKQVVQEPSLEMGLEGLTAFFEEEEYKPRDKDVILLAELINKELTPGQKKKAYRLLIGILMQLRNKDQPLEAYLPVWEHTKNTSRIPNDLHQQRAFELLDKILQYQIDLENLELALDQSELFIQEHQKIDPNDSKTINELIQCYQQLETKYAIAANHYHYFYEDRHIQLLQNSENKMAELSNLAAKIKQQQLDRIKAAIKNQNEVKGFEQGKNKVFEHTYLFNPPPFALSTHLSPTAQGVQKRKEQCQADIHSALSTFLILDVYFQQRPSFNALSQLISPEELLHILPCLENNFLELYGDTSRFKSANAQYYKFIIDAKCVMVKQLIVEIEASNTIPQLQAVLQKICFLPGKKGPTTLINLLAEILEDAQGEDKIKIKNDFDVYMDIIRNAQIKLMRLQIEEVRSTHRKNDNRKNLIKIRVHGPEPFIVGMRTQGALAPLNVNVKQAADRFSDLLTILSRLSKNNGASIFEEFITAIKAYHNRDKEEKSECKEIQVNYLAHLCDVHTDKRIRFYLAKALTQGHLFNSDFTEAELTQVINAYALQKHKKMVYDLYLFYKPRSGDDQQVAENATQLAKSILASRNMKDWLLNPTNKVALYDLIGAVQQASLDEITTIFKAWDISNLVLERPNILSIIALFNQSELTKNWVKHATDHDALSPETFINIIHELETNCEALKKIQNRTEANRNEIECLEKCIRSLLSTLPKYLENEHIFNAENPHKNIQAIVSLVAKARQYFHHELNPSLNDYVKNLKNNNKKDSLGRNMKWDAIGALYFAPGNDVLLTEYLAKAENYQSPSRIRKFLNENPVTVASMSGGMIGITVGLSPRMQASIIGGTTLIGGIIGHCIASGGAFLTAIGITTAMAPLIFYGLMGFTAGAVVGKFFEKISSGIKKITHKITNTAKKTYNWIREKFRYAPIEYDELYNTLQGALNHLSAKELAARFHYINDEGKVVPNEHLPNFIKMLKQLEDNKKTLYCKDKDAEKVLNALKAYKTGYEKINTSSTLATIGWVLLCILFLPYVYYRYFGPADYVKDALKLAEEVLLKQPKASTDFDEPLTNSSMSEHKSEPREAVTMASRQDEHDTALTHESGTQHRRRALSIDIEEQEPASAPGTPRSSTRNILRHAPPYTAPMPRRHVSFVGLHTAPVGLQPVQSQPNLHSSEPVATAAPVVGLHEQRSAQPTTSVAAPALQPTRSQPNLRISEPVTAAAPGVGLREERSAQPTTVAAPTAVVTIPTQPVVEQPRSETAAPNNNNGSWFSLFGMSREKKEELARRRAAKRAAHHPSAIAVR